MSIAPPSYNGAPTQGLFSVDRKWTVELPESPVGQERPEQKLEIMNQLYRYVTEVTNDCLWEWNLVDKEFFWIDGGHKRVFGYPVVNASVSQTFWENRIHHGDKARILTRLNTLIGAGTAVAWEDEYRFQRLDGEYCYVHDRAHIIYVKGKPTRMIGATQDITARKSGEIQLLESERKLALEKLGRQKAITEAVLSAQEAEREDIGKELHDNLNQVLGAAKLYIEMAKTDEENREFCLDKSSHYLLDVIESIRNISKRLAFPGMHIMGLFENIRILIDDLVSIDPVEIEFHNDGINEESFTPKLRIDIFRIIQEQLNNILKHARASVASINLARDGDRVLLIISDNGQGCDLSKNTEGIGILNMYSRVESQGGKMSISSKPGEGFVLTIAFPGR